jgi:predicted nucleic acid-binding protein
VSIGGSLVLDAEGLVKLAVGDPRATAPFEAIRRRRGHVVTAASILTEVLRGVRRDAALLRVLVKVTTVPIDARLARSAGELLGQARLSGHRHALDALVAVVALDQPRPVVLLTSDPADLAALTAEPERPASERVTVVRV